MGGASQYYKTANAAVNAAVEALVDAKSLEDKSAKRRGYLEDARAAGVAAHENLAKASRDSGLGDLPAAKIKPIHKKKKHDALLAKKYEQAAGEAVNVAEIALDNLAAVGHPNVLPSVEDKTVAF